MVKTFINRELSQNTICYRGHQISFDVNTRQHSAITVNTGHWGPDVYPGCGRVRAGESVSLDKKNYTQAINGRQFSNLNSINYKF